MISSSALVINTKSRHGRVACSHLVDQFHAKGMGDIVVFEVKNPGELPDLFKQLVKDGFKRVIVGGGDGTLTTAISFFAKTDIMLGIIPLGTGNSFAKSLGIPATLDDAIETVLTGVAQQIDLGWVNGRYFANVAEIGLTALMARQTARGLKRRYGVLAYVLVGLRNLVSHRSFICRIETADRSETFAAHQIFVANGKYYGLTAVSPAASLTNRQLVILAFKTTNIWASAKLWSTFLLGRQTRLPDSDTWFTTACTIDTIPSRYVSIDGEMIGQTPAVFKVVPQALRVLVPPVPFEEAERDETEGRHDDR